MLLEKTGERTPETIERWSQSKLKMDLPTNETTNKELISKIYKQLMQLNTRKMNNPIKKWPKEQTDISPKKTYRRLINT